MSSDPSEMDAKIPTFDPLQVETIFDEEGWVVLQRHIVRPSVYVIYSVFVLWVTILAVVQLSDPSTILSEGVVVGILIGFSLFFLILLVRTTVFARSLAKKNMIIIGKTRYVYHFNMEQDFVEVDAFSSRTEMHAKILSSWFNRVIETGRYLFLFGLDHRAYPLDKQTLTAADLERLKEWLRRYIPRYAATRASMKKPKAKP